MSDSDSELSATVPSNAEIEKGLRAAFRKLYHDPEGDASINSIRRAAETQLGLEEGFLKEAEWKAKSKAIIQEEVEKDEDADEVEETTTKPESKTTKVKQKPEAKKPAKTAGTKRKADKKETAKNKKRKVSEEPESEDELDSGASSPPPTKARNVQASEDDFSAAETPVKSKTKKRKSSAGSDDELSEAESPKPKKTAKNSGDRDASSSLSDAASETPAPAAVTAPTKDDDASESEMSVLIDDSPPPKRKKSSSGSSKPTEKEKKPRAKSSKESAAPDPDQEEIKKLQGQLGQCGIRKVWGKYLKPYETPRAKIKHLKEMLVEAGMTGRFSIDKAKQIMEQRELAADLEAVTEGNKVWGRRRGNKGGAQEEAEGERPKRALAKGLAELDFISDGEED